MSDDSETTVKTKLSLAAIIAIFGAYGSVVGGYVMLRGEVNANIRRLEVIEVKQDRDADIRSRDLDKQNAFQAAMSDAVSRIDERTKYIVGQVQEIKAQVDKGR